MVFAGDDNPSVKQPEKQVCQGIEQAIPYRGAFNVVQSHKKA
jgi:hypothetical protein